MTILNRLVFSLFNNTTPKQIFLKNSVWLIFANIITICLKFFLIPYAATKLGPERFGFFNYTLSISILFFIFCDAGLNLLIPRELPSHTSPSEFLSASFFLRLSLLIISFTVYLGCSFFFTDEIVRQIYAYIGLMTFMSILSTFFTACLHAKNKLEYVALSTLICNLITSILGIVFLTYQPQITAYVYAYLIGTFCSLIFLIYHSKTLIQTLHIPKLVSIILVLKKGAPFLITALLHRLLLTSDTLIVKWWLGADEVGYYQAALKLFSIIFMFAMFISQSIYPLLTEFKNDLPKLRIMVRKGLASLLIISIPISFGAYLLADEIIVSLFGIEYYPSITPFRILFISLVPIYILYLLNRILLVFNYEKTNLVYSGFSLGTNIIINFSLLPFLGIIGISIGTVTAKLLDLLLTIRLTHKELSINYFPWKNALNYVLSSVFMSLILHFSIMPLNLYLWLTISSGVLSYFFFLLILRDSLILQGIHTLKAIINRQ